MECPLVLIPAAGFGRRVGSPPAKELLPLRAGRPLIEGPVLEGRRRDWPVHIITRDDKASLIEYCEANFPDVNIQRVSLTQEWPQTILASEKYWRDWNLLVLPDVDFHPVDIWGTMADLRQDVDLVVATHLVSDPEKWGGVWCQKEQIFVSEKVNVGELGESAGQGQRKQRFSAWGLLMFHKRIGKELFQSFIDSRDQGQALPLSFGTRANFVALRSFRDLTR